MENKTEELKSLKPGVKELCDEHWKYVEGVLIAGEEPIEPFSTMEKKLAVIEFHYKSAFFHGHKHGVESVGKAAVVAQRIINHAILETKFPSLRKNSVEKESNAAGSAWKSIRDAFKANKDFKLGYVNNIAYFLRKRCGVVDPEEQHIVAEDLLKLIFY